METFRQFCEMINNIFNDFAGLSANEENMYMLRGRINDIQQRMEDISIGRIIMDDIEHTHRIVNVIGDLDIIIDIQGITICAKKECDIFVVEEPKSITFRSYNDNTYLMEVYTMQGGYYGEW